MTDAQQWLDKIYPTKERKGIERIGRNGEGLLRIFSNIPRDLTGKFTNFEEFIDLTELYLPFIKISIKSIKSFPNSLERLQLAANSFPESTLTPSSHLINLKWLDIGLINCNKVGEHNQWIGTLKPPKNLTKLEWLCLGTTDVNGGIEYLLLISVVKVMILIKNV